MIKNNSDIEELINISNKFSSNDVICKEILEILGNSKSKIKLDENIKNNYYVFLNDTIYLCNKEKNKKNYQRICVIAHECIHSIQSKTMQVINFILSNLELIAFVITAVCVIFKFYANITLYVYVILNIVSAVPRLLLEMDATTRSVGLTKKYIKDKINDEESNVLIRKYKTQMLKFSPFFVLSLLAGRIIRCILIYLLYLI